MKFVMGVAALFLGLALQASAQTSVIYAEDFDGVTAGTFPSGWTADAATGTPAVGWKVDNLPAADGLSTGKYTFGGGCYGWAPIPAGTSPNATLDTAPNSLNFNNDVDTENGALFSGAAMSPAFTLSTTAGVTLSFFCYFEGLSCDTEVVAAKFGTDQKFVEIMDAAGTTVVASYQLVVYNGTAPAVIPPATLIPARGTWPAPPAGLDANCTELGVPHFHVIDLSTLPVGTYRVRFRSNEIIESTTVATVGPDTHWIGWFVDTLQVICPAADILPPAATTLLSPADLACTANPVTFDWTDSVDTGPCGPGAIDHYDLEIDTTAAFGAPTVISVPGSTTSGSGPLGVFFWRVRAFDSAGNPSPYSSIFSFTNELAALPLPPDTLFVNDSMNGAQVGNPGFVSPVVDEQPHFSAVYRDPNCIGLALQYHMQVSTDPTFTIVDVDTGVQALTPSIAKDQRCSDLTISTNLQRDTVYYWRVLFGDASGLGPYSLPQSFRTGDDFEFGVRQGSTHHGRKKCWVATAAWGSQDAAPVQALQSWRFGTMEGNSAGSLFSRFYHVTGAVASSSFRGSESARAATLPLAWAVQSAIPVFLLGLAIVLFGAFRVGKSS